MDNEKKYKERTNAVIYWFRKQDFSSSKYAFNRCIQDLTQSDIIHCELYFVDRAYTVCITSNTSLTFYKGSKVEYKNRDIWEGYIVYLSEQQVRNLWNYCKQDKGREFDRFGLVFFYCFSRDTFPFRFCVLMSMSIRDPSLCCWRRMMMMAPRLHHSIREGCSAGAVCARRRRTFGLQHHSVYGVLSTASQVRTRIPSSILRAPVASLL